MIAAGLLFGAVLPLVFATGLRALSADTAAPARPATRLGPERLPGDPQPGRTSGWPLVCFAVVVASVGFGIYLIMHKS